MSLLVLAGVLQQVAHFEIMTNIENSCEDFHTQWPICTEFI